VTPWKRSTEKIFTVNNLHYFKKVSSMYQIEHRCAYLSHFVEELLREGAHPFIQGNQVDWLDHLVRGAFPVRDPDTLEKQYSQL
jgi:hypothetical protein